jgi:hypothetical protein
LASVRVRYNMNVMCHRFACAALLLLAGVNVATAQPNSTALFNSATPDVEAALRARITGFFEAQQQGKWRQAEKFVAEDSIDAYLERDKKRYSKFEIRAINWVGEGFKEATVNMIVPFDMTLLGVGEVDGGAPFPITHHWKLEDGDWYWFVPKVDPCKPIETPMGKITPVCKDGKPVADEQADAQRALNRMIESNQVKPEMLQGRVTASSSQVQLSKKNAGEETITIKNAFDGPVTLDLIGGDMVGLSIAFDDAKAESPRRITLDAKKTATLRMKFQPTPSGIPDRLGVQVRVEPLSMVLPLDILFADK